MDLGLLYQNNIEFRQYVDKYAEHYMDTKPIPVEEALKHNLVKEVADMYYSKPNEEQG